MRTRGIKVILTKLGNTRDIIGLRMKMINSARDFLIFTDVPRISTDYVGWLNIFV